MDEERLDEIEKGLVRMISSIIRKSYIKAAKPYVDQLADIRALRIVHRPIIVSINDCTVKLHDFKK